MKFGNQIFRLMFFVTSVVLFCACNKKELPRPNILLIVADDMNYDSPGFAGGVAPDVTPNIDRLAGQSFSFTKAFSAVSVCQPSRQSMLSGLLPNHYGSAGFFPMADGTPTLPSILREAGYLTGNIHKEHHMLPIEAFNWHYNNERLGLTAGDAVVGRDPEGMAEAFRSFINIADDEKKPFFMIVNSADPHRPFHGDPVKPGSWYWGYDEINLPEPSRVYTAEEVNVPPNLPDLPGIRKDLAKYASSVRRLDDAVGKCLKVLEDLDKDKSTLVMFVADNGMPLPYAKFDCYLSSNRTSLLMRWPELIQSPKIDNEHLVSLMDITPTVLELTGVQAPSNLDGKSLVPFLQNQVPENWRESIVFLRNDDIYYPSGIKGALKRDPDFIKKLEAIGWVPRPDHPHEGTYSREKEMRAFYDGKYGYVYNHCYSDEVIKPGQLGAIVPYGDPAFNAMKFASKQDSIIKERYDFYLAREQEELYDWTTDPGSRNNLIDDPQYAEVLSKARSGLLQWLKTNNDPLAEDFQYMFESTKWDKSNSKLKN